METPTVGGALRRVDPGARVGDQVFDSIHEAILDGTLPAGHRLRIRELADELGTSVMPVREAIRRLEEIGLAEAVPYKGAVVKQFTDEELLHVYAVRRLLEVEAAAAGVAGIAADGRTRLERVLGSMRDAVAEGEVVAYLDRDEEFLEILYDAAGNPVLTTTIRGLWYRCRSYKIVGARRALDSGQADRLLAYQTSLLDAVVAGDREAAARVTAESLDVATERIRSALPDAPAPA